MGTFSRQTKKVHRTAKVHSLVVIAFSPGGKLSKKMLRSSISMDTISRQQKSVFWILFWSAGIPADQNKIQKTLFCCLEIVSIEMLDLSIFLDNFPPGEKAITTRLWTLAVLWTFFVCLEKVPIELRTFAVLWTLFCLCTY